MNTIVILLHLIRRREEEGINHLKQDQDIIVSSALHGQNTILIEGFTVTPTQGFNGGFGGCVAPPMCHCALDVMLGLLRTRNELEEDLVENKDISQSLDKAIPIARLGILPYDGVFRKIDNYALANRAFIPGRNLDLEHYWSASQVMDHGPRGSVHMTISRCWELTIDDNQVKPAYQHQYNVTLSKGRENWAREFANERVHHGPVDDQ
ncbi:hypothetical protein Tco_0255009 [Tanacetum coccineum]